MSSINGHDQCIVSALPCTYSSLPHQQQGKGQQLQLHLIEVDSGLIISRTVSGQVDPLVVMCLTVREDCN